MGDIKCSGDRIACFPIQTSSIEELKEKHSLANKRIKALGTDDEDLIRHDLVSNLLMKCV